MENVVMVKFDVESQAFQAFSQLKNDSVNSAYTILQMAVVKNEKGRITALDGFDSGVDTSNDTLMGGLIGALIGILGGPIGILLGGGIGLLAGSIKDSNDADSNASLIEHGSTSLKEGETALIALVQEQDEKAFNLRLQDYKCEISRWDAAEVAQEVEHAQEVQKQLAKEAKQKLREEKKADRKKAIEEKRAGIKAKFDDFKNKFSSQN